LTEPVAVSEPAAAPRRSLPGVLRDPSAQSVAVLVLLALGGAVTLYLGWRGAARIPSYVPPQMPWLMSGGLAGLAVLGTALGAWSIHLSRRSDAQAQYERSLIQHELIELCEDLRTGRRALPGQVKTAPARKRATPRKRAAAPRKRAAAKS
jgi:hypothetical protein